MIDAVVANPKNLKKRVDLSFVVDTGAGMTAIPADVAKRLGLDYVATAEVALADATVIQVKLAYAYINIHGEHIFTLVGCGGCDQPLLGFDVMSLLQLELDIANKRCLRPVRRFKVLRIIWKKMLGEGHWIG